MVIQRESIEEEEDVEHFEDVKEEDDVDPSKETEKAGNDVEIKHEASKITSRDGDSSSDDDEVLADRQSDEEDNSASDDDDDADFSMKSPMRKKNPRRFLILDMSNHMIGSEILSLAEEDVAPEDLVFHKFYVNKMNSTKQSKKKKKKKLAEEEAAEELYDVDGGDGGNDESDVEFEGGDESDNEEIENMLDAGDDDDVVETENGAFYWMPVFRRRCIVRRSRRSRSSNFRYRNCRK